jgi:hypothetical protein
MAGAGELQRLIEGGVPEDSLRFFGRWWQFETYLREVVYLELRARDGVRYPQAVGKRPLDRARGDERNAYMASADLEPLAYLDAGELMALIDANWDLFETTLLPEDRWKADASLIRTLRNRVSHCRRPHADDLGRLRQLLRDLEYGARIFYTSATRADLEIPRRDPLWKAWVKGGHEVADRLLEHAARQYDTRFRLRATRRPWAPEAEGQISGTPGHLWHATWILGGREIEAAALWTTICERVPTAELIVHLLMPNPFVATVTFAAVDGSDAVADAIGAVFDSVLETSVPMRDFDLVADDSWGRAARDLPAKVQTYSAMALFDDANPVTIFGASAEY